VETNAKTVFSSPRNKAVLILASKCLKLERFLTSLRLKKPSVNLTILVPLLILDSPPFRCNGVFAKFMQDFFSSSFPYEHRSVAVSHALPLLYQHYQARNFYCIETGHETVI